MRNFPFPIAAVSCIPIVFIAGCNQNNGPSQAQVQESLKAQLPSYSQLESFQIKKSENLGTETEPKIQSRFKASLRVSEDLFNTTVSDDLNLISHPLADKTKFIEKTTSEGEKIKLYGLSVSEQYEDTWKTEFEFEENPFRELGIPREKYKERTIVKGSDEEKKYTQELEQANKKFRNNAVSTLFSREHKGYLGQSYGQIPFILNFTSYDKNSGNIEGTISFENGFMKKIKTVKRIQGKFSKSKINFTTTGFITGKEKDTWGLGTEYSINMNEQWPRQEYLIGSWKHPGKPDGALAIELN